MKIHQYTFFVYLFFCKLVDGQDQECSSYSSQECIAEDINISTKTISHEECMQKMKDGECNTNMSFMFQNCSAECIRDSKLGTVGVFHPDTKKIVESQDCDDFADPKDCNDFADQGECSSNPAFMMEHCAKTCLACFSPGSEGFEIGVPQEIPLEHKNNAAVILDILKNIEETSKYLSETVLVDEDYESVRYDCINRDAHCAALAATGACEEPEDYEDMDVDTEDEATNLFEFMVEECAPACNTCQELMHTETDRILELCKPDITTNVFRDDEEEPVEDENGKVKITLNQMFEKLVGELPFDDDIILPDYTANILSRPLKEGDNEDNVDYNVGPWIITLDNFLTDEECDRLIKLGAKEGYERSVLEEEWYLDEEEVEKEKASEDAYRTSSNSWCNGNCYKDPVAKRVMQKIENATGIPERNSEYLQLLRYVPGNYYKEHHDYIDGQENENPGPRMITFFLYLNDVEAGGGTRFTDIHGDDSFGNIDVQPKKGRALVWPSTLSEDLDLRDDRTYHEALVVEKGLKYGANAWLHLRNFKDDDCPYEEFEEIVGNRRQHYGENTDDEE